MKVPGLPSPSLVEQYSKETQKAEPVVLPESFATSEKDKHFYENQLKESRYYFGEPKWSGDICTFVNMAGAPHIGLERSLPSDEYAQLHNDEFGTQFEKEAFSEYVPLHHVVWLLSKEGPLSWEKVSQLNTVEQHEIFQEYSSLIQKDRAFISSASQSEAIVTIALGYTDPTKGLKASQSRESIHVHVVPPPPENVDLYFQEAPITNDIKKFDLDNTYRNFVENHFDEFARKAITDSFQKFTNAEFTIESGRTEDQIFDPYSINLEFAEGVQADDMLLALADMYSKLNLVWSTVVNQDDPNVDSRTLALRKIYNDSESAPDVPSYNVITKWDAEYNTVKHISIAPSQRGPAERMNNAALLRMFN